MTKDRSSEEVNHTFVFVGNITEKGKPIFRGVSVYNNTSHRSIAKVDASLYEVVFVDN
jgi:hypothetical protein